MGVKARSLACPMRVAPQEQLQRRTPLMARPQLRMRPETLLPGAAGTAVDGLSLKILGGASGDLGSVSFGIGVGAQLNTLIKTLLETDGLLDARVTGLNTSVADVTKQRTVLEAKALALEARYRSQFNGLETIISSLTATQSFLTTALSQFVDPLAFKK